MKTLKRLSIRRRAMRGYDRYIIKRGFPDTPKHHRRLLRYLRVGKGKAPFVRSVAELTKYPLEAANHLETYYLTTGKPIDQSPFYLVARLSLALDGFCKGVRG